MERTVKKSIWSCLLTAVVVLCAIVPAQAGIPGITGPAFNLTAKSGYISTADGGSYLMWGYANGAGEMQYPGPTLIVNQNDVVTINLTNELSVPVSIVFPGQSGVVASGGSPGLLTSEAAASGGAVSYSFTASQPGTYTYYSGTNPELQTEMGLVGALIVRPTGFDETTNKIAYNTPDSAYEHEFLFLGTEMDPRIHDLVAQGNTALVDNAAYWAVYWLLNGRTAPDTMTPNNNPELPHQPYNCMPMTHPGEKVLVRIVGAGRDMHPYHLHGNHHRVIARDGRLLSSDGVDADLGQLAFTTDIVPGSTADAIFVWTGEKLGWDMYGYTHDTQPTYCDAGGNPTAAYPANKLTQLASDRCKPIPVILPDQLELTNGQFYSGSPYLGTMGFLPPGEGGFNPNSGFLYMWHSHNEKEITNNDIFPGGMLTMFIVEPPDAELTNP